MYLLFKILIDFLELLYLGVGLDNSCSVLFRFHDGLAHGFECFAFAYGDFLMDGGVLII